MHQVLLLFTRRRWAFVLTQFLHHFFPAITFSVKPKYFCTKVPSISISNYFYAPVLLQSITSNGSSSIHRPSLVLTQFLHHFFPLGTFSAGCPAGQSGVSGRMDELRLSTSCSLTSNQHLQFFFVHPVTPSIVPNQNLWLDPPHHLSFPGSPRPILCWPITNPIFQLVFVSDSKLGGVRFSH